ncbi:hypothetical protein [Methylobacterium sp. A54F]
MNRRIAGLAALCLAATGASGSALARGGSYTPPAGQAAATAPGGTQGLAGPRNVSEAVRSGQAIGVPRRPDRGGFPRPGERAPGVVPPGPGRF